jgi:ureidoacrylate peracid hydrolase
MDTALLLIDIQNAFCDPDASVGAQGRDMSACITAAGRCLGLAEAARAKGVPVIWTRYVLRSDYADGGILTEELRPNIKTAGGLAAGSSDADFWVPEAVLSSDFVIDKPRMSALIGTSLAVILRSLGVTEIFVAGVTTSMCVESTVRDLSQHDYRVFVVEDAVADFDGERHAASLRAMEFGFARLIDSSVANDLWSADDSRKGTGHGG